MQTTLALDDVLVREAQALTGINEKAALVREALTALVQRRKGVRVIIDAPPAVAKQTLTPSFPGEPIFAEPWQAQVFSLTLHAIDSDGGSRGA